MKSVAISEKREAKIEQKAVVALLPDAEALLLHAEALLLDAEAMQGQLEVKVQNVVVLQ